MLKVFSLEFFMADVPCKLVTVNPGSTGEPEQRRHFQHSHSGCEIHCVYAGELTMDCIGASFQLTAGQMLLMGFFGYILAEKIGLLKSFKINKSGLISTIVLTVIGVIVAGLLAVVNMLTESVIADAENAARNTSLVSSAGSPPPMEKRDLPTFPRGIIGSANACAARLRMVLTALTPTWT